MIEFTIPDMTCGHCVATVEKAIKKADPSASAKVDLAARKAQVETRLEPSVIGSSIEDAGYTVSFTQA